ncbi:MAG: DUF4339 domain-containing protein [Halobacteriovoraceae bacterium]|jgi:hypothetical protein|nr:DUF4339 domain-containing protein [Halobacteriovoraceae bacterium]
MTEKSWFIFKGDHHLGPYQVEEILRLFNSGKLDDSAMLWKEGSQEWLPFHAQKELLGALSPDTNFKSVEDLEAFETNESIDANSMPKADIENDAIFEDPLAVWNAATEKEKLVSNEEALPLVEEITTSEHGLWNEDSESVEEAIENDEGPPPLPPIPDSPQLDSLPHFEAPEEQENLEPTNPNINLLVNELGEGSEDWGVEDITPPKGTPLPKEMLEEMQESERERQGPYPEEGAEEFPEEIETEDLEEEEEEEEEEEPKFVNLVVKDPDDAFVKYPYLKYVVGLACAFGLIASLYFLSKGGEKEKRLFINLKPKWERRLKNVATGGSKWEFDMAVATNGGELWVASRHAGPLTLFLTLTSIRGKVITSEPIVVTSKTLLENHGGLFDKWSIVEGPRLEPGYYKYELTAYQTGQKAKVLRFLKETDLAKDWDWVKASKKKYQKRGSLLFYPGSDDDFFAKLKEYKINKKEKRLRPVRDLLEKYRTLDSLANTTKNLFKKMLLEAVIGKDIEKFERRYGLEVSPILQGIVLNNHKIQVSLVEADHDLSLRYGKVVTYGKQIGVVISELASSVRDKKKLRQKDRNKILNSLESQFNTLNELGKIRIKEIEEEIENFVF